MEHEHSILFAPVNALWHGVQHQFAWDIPDHVIMAFLVLVISAILFFAVLIRGHKAPLADPGQYRFSIAVHQPVRVPAALNGFALWLTLMIALTAINYGYPIAQLLALKGNAVPAVYVGAAR